MYRWDAEDYARNSAGQQEWALELIPKLGLKGNERVLDVGCGDGKITAAIADALDFGSVLGIDSSPEMVAHATKAFPENRARLAFACLDVREISFLREFDVVFSNAALHWVPDHGPLLGKNQARAAAGRQGAASNGRKGQRGRCSGRSKQCRP